jgi:hypothetical protein
MGSRRRRDPRAREPRPRGRLVDGLPRWEGSPGFAPVARALQAVLDLPPLEMTAAGVDIISGVDLVAFQALAVLASAHPVYIGPGQLAVLPPWSTDSSWEDAAAALRYAAELQLPFDPLFLDFTSDTGEPSWVGDRQSRCALYGALLFREEKDIPGAMVRGGELAIIPFGVVIDDGEGRRRPLVWLDDQLLPSQAALGMLTVGCQQLAPRDGELWMGECGLAGHISTRAAERMLAIAGVIPADLTLTLAPINATGLPVPARVCAGTGGILAPLIGAFRAGQIGTVTFEQARRRSPEAVSSLIAESSIVFTLAAFALRALFLLDSSNVELTSVQLTRQVRRAVERSEGRAKIAMTVSVRLPKHSSRQSGKTGGQREFAYAFERVGHYRHITQGRQAVAEHMKPCTRQDEAHRASGGRCRRVWIPDHVVGAAPGKPLIRKTRVVSTKDTGKPGV